MHLEKREKNTMQLLESLKTQHDTNIWRYNPKNYGFSKVKRTDGNEKNIYIFSKNINLRHFYFQAIHLVPDTVPGNNLLSYSKVFFSSTVRILFGE